MIPSYFTVIRDGFDWYGLEVKEQNKTLHITEGRIGLSDNPLHIEDGCVSAGWYVPETTIEIHDEDRSVDILLDKASQACVYLVRHNTGDECYNEQTHTLLLSLAQRQSSDDPWLIAEPLRIYYE